MEITSISELQIYAQGQTVELPPFGEGQPFVAKLKRPSILAMVKSGRIPNELLVTASRLFSGESKNSSDKDSVEALIQTEDMLEVICEASFVSPTYDEIKSAGVELTDEQKHFVFSYAQNGIRALNNFRTE